MKSGNYKYVWTKKMSKENLYKVFLIAFKISKSDKYSIITSFGWVDNFFIPILI